MEQYEKINKQKIVKEKMDLSGFETYLAYSLRGAKAQADTNEDSTFVGQQTEEKKDEETQQDV